MDYIRFKSIMDKYDKPQRDKIKDFLISEIDNDNLEETIDFVLCDDQKKVSKYSDILCNQEEYSGVFLEGNQYLITSNEDKVTIIDYVSKFNGLINNIEIQFDLADFIFLISNVREVLNY